MCCLQAAFRSVPCSIFLLKNCDYVDNSFTIYSELIQIFFPVPGDEFALHGEGIYCKDDHELFERCEDNNNLDPKHRIKTELDDFRDNLSDFGREDDSYR